jgi:hypothetical protein
MDSNHADVHVIGVVATTQQPLLPSASGNRTRSSGLKGQRAAITTQCAVRTAYEDRTRTDWLRTSWATITPMRQVTRGRGRVTGMIEP